MTMPPVVAGIALLSTLGRRGVLGPSLEAAGIRVSFSTLAVVIAQVFVSMPYLVVTLEAALRSRDTRLETIARTLGAREWRVLTRITLPLVGPALARGTALALGRSLGEFGATIAFAGSKDSRPCFCCPGWSGHDARRAGFRTFLLPLELRRPACGQNTVVCRAGPGCHMVSDRSASRFVPAAACRAVAGSGRKYGFELWRCDAP